METVSVFIVLRFCLSTARELLIQSPNGSSQRAQTSAKTAVTVALT